MVFAEDDLRCDIFALASIDYPVDLCWAMIVGRHFSGLFFLIHYWHCSGTLCLFCLKISESNSTYVSLMDF